MQLGFQIEQALPNDKCVHALLVLLKLEDLFLGHGDILLPDIHFSGINWKAARCCCRVWRLLQIWKAQLSDCLCAIGPAFILLLDVVGLGIFCISDVKGMTFKS